MRKYVNANILDLLMIDNLLQSAKIDNSHYILHEDFRPYDKSKKDLEKYMENENGDNDNDNSDRWGVNEPKTNRRTKFMSKNMSIAQTAPSKK